ncbi:MAG TPA: hypothetical protein VM925_14805 [Labilithrix sp.]|nr:hypothetical protein [Labilithrix sp.]
MSGRIALQLAMPPDWERIETVRQAVALCVGTVFGETNLQHSISMVSAELLENAVKHGNSADPVGLSIEERQDTIVIVVTNRSDDVEQNTRLLSERIAWIRSFEDAEAAYIAAMEKAYAEMSTGGLGLPRIIHEGCCAVTWATPTPGQIAVSAVLDVPPAARSVTVAS